MRVMRVLDSLLFFVGHVGQARGKVEREQGGSRRGVGQVAAGARPFERD